MADGNEEPVSSFTPPLRGGAGGGDGDSHFTNQGMDYNKIRTAYLESQGYRIIRYDNFQVLSNLDGVFHDLTLRLAL